MATRKINPAILAALAARAQGAGAGPIQGAPGGAPMVGVPGGAPTGGMPGGPAGMKRGGKVKKMAAGGSASSRGDGIAQRGKTVGAYC